MEGNCGLKRLISPIPDDKGRVTRLLTASRDITERKRADDKLRESEFTVRTLLESASQGIIVVDPKGRIVLANRAAEDMFGYRKEELLENRIDNLIPQTFARAAQQRAQAFLPRAREHADGSWLEFVWPPQEWEGVPG